MEVIWIWVLITLTILFCFLVVSRLMYIKGFKAGARRIISEWKESLNEEEYKDDETV